MFGIFKFGAGVVTGSVLTLGAMNYHVVRTDETVALVPKRAPTLADTYMDVREWTVSDWTDHPDFVWALYKADRQDLIAGLDGKFASLKNLFEK